MNTATGYLCIEPYLAHFTAAQALRVALGRGVIDAIEETQWCSIDALAQALDSDPAGLHLLCESLRAADIVTGDQERYALTEEFRRALVYRDLLEAKLDFANLLAPDLIEHFHQYIDDFPGFMRQSRVFDLFRYDRCYQRTEENYEATRAWMRFTTALTRYEAPVCAVYHDFSRVRRLLDIGGNSGEFARQLCRQIPQLQADVFDLPVVCEVGREYLQGSPESPRIGFIPGDVLRDELPHGYDMITFKSMLHDWPVEAVEIMLGKAASAVEPDGTILIYERGPLDLAGAATNFGLLPMLLFFRNFRSPEVYARMLRQYGFSAIEIQAFQLDTPFFVLSARRGPDRT